MIKPDWIAVDWGTTHMRAWAMAADGRDLDQHHCDQGMGGLTPEEFEPVLRDALSRWELPATCPVIACGMVGSRQGWVEAPYQSAPCPARTQLVSAPVTGGGLDVQILAGVSQASPADVMRGEETQIAGFLHLNPNWDGVICLPGTHTKWVQVSAGEIVSFQTFMTGEVFGLLSSQSILRHSVGDDWSNEDFITGINAVISRPEALAAKLFSLRAEGLLGDGADSTTARLSGMLIGAELAAAKPYWLGQQIAMIGAPKLARLYARALNEQGVPSMATDAEAMTLAGLKAAYLKWKKS